LFKIGARAIGIFKYRKDADLHGIKIIGGNIYGCGDDFQTNLADAGSEQLDLTRGGFGKIDDTTIDERAAVDDANVDGFVVGEIGDVEPSIERHDAMGSDEGFHVVGFAVGGFAAVIRNAVPTGNALFGIANRERSDGLSGAGPLST